jgi:succinate-semialdehyde dehydrogenase/glutarate-semialdehyde dehydrogenase
MTYEAIDPHTGNSLRRQETATPAELRSALERAAEGFLPWHRTGFDERAGVLRAAARLLRGRADEHGRLMAEEMGKPIAAGRAEAEKCAWVCEYYADHAEGFLADEPVATDATRSYVAHRPLGPILAIMPWNFPYWQVFRFAAPALMAGNTVLLKHAPNVPGCAERLERLMLQAGLPERCFQSVYLTDRQAGAVIRDRRVRGVTLTGSVRAGKAVAKQAGAHVKKTVLELGGSGAVCREPPGELGPELHRGEALHRHALRRQALHGGRRRAHAIRQGRQSDGRDHRGRPAGARGPPCNAARAGGGQRRQGRALPARRPGPGRAGLVLSADGPVASILEARDRGHAIRLANDTTFGLGAAVFTANVAEGERIARDELNAGCCFVNTFVRSDPRLPFGGVMDSGYGRELGRHGIHEFVNAKTVWVA